MKKNYLFGMLALAAMTMVGCSNDEVVNDYSQDNAIQFGTYVGRGASSRAHVIDTKTLGTEGFGVFAYYTNTDDFDASKHDPNFMYDQKVTASSNNWVEETTDNSGSVTPGYYTEWTYDPIKYWPNNVNDKVSFFAYAPHSTTTNSNVTVANADGKAGYPIVTFEVEHEDVTKQSDLLWAAPVLNLSKNNSENPIDVDDKVKFVFKHALSRIAFEVQTMIDKVNPDKDGDVDSDTDNGLALDQYTKVVVKQVTLSGNFYTGGIMTWDTSGKAAVTGTSPTATTFTLSSANFNDPETINWGSKTPQYSMLGQSVDETEEQLNAEDSYIMVVPQNFSTEDLTINIKYDVVTQDDALASGYSKVENDIKTTFSGVNFLPNKAYKFSLHLGLTTVKLTASVDGWEEGTDYSVNLPINTIGTDNSSEGVEEGTGTASNN